MVPHTHQPTTHPPTSAFPLSLTPAKAKQVQQLPKTLAILAFSLSFFDTELG